MAVNEVGVELGDRPFRNAGTLCSDLVRGPVPLTLTPGLVRRLKVRLGGAPLFCSDGAPGAGLSYRSLCIMPCQLL